LGCWLWGLWEAGVSLAMTRMWFKLIGNRPKAGAFPSSKLGRDYASTRMAIGRTQ
jgi:hypothetical protein